MSSSCVFIALVDQLATRHDGVCSGTSHTQDVEERISRLFLIACDLMAAFHPADLHHHLEDMVIRQWAALLHGENLVSSSPASTHDSATTTSSYSPLPPERIPTLITASGALLGYACVHIKEFEASGVGEEWIEGVCQRWQSSLLQLLSAQPPFSAEARTAACYTVAQLSLLPNCCCEPLLHAACEALVAGREDGLSATMATELLGQITSLMVMCKPFQLHGTVLEDPVGAAAVISGKGAAGAKAVVSAAGTHAGKRARLSTQRPAAGSAGAAASALNSSVFEPPASKCSAIPSCYPIPSIERFQELRQVLVQCCLTSLGATMAVADGATSAAVSARGSSQAPQQHQHQQHRAVPIALLCQRVLIPLLLFDGSQGLEKYEELVHTFLCTLANCPVDFSTPMAVLPAPPHHKAGAASGTATGVAKDAVLLLDEDKCDEVVLLIAALFDFLFRRPSLDPRTDFRFSGFLWTVLSSALYRSLTSTKTDAGHRANMQLRVEYLLKRIVYMTKEQQQQQHQAGMSTGSQSVALPPIIEFHPLFRWCAATGSSGSASGNRDKAAAAKGESLSATTWDNFFLVLESLNEYGWHIIEPVMARLDTIIAQLDSWLESEASPCDAIVASTGDVLSAALHPRWIEILLLKLILHPNLGVRKVGLRQVWALPPRVQHSLSSSFLFHYVFQSSSDPRLCGNLDRIPITASFLDTKAFEGSEVKAVPSVEPLAQEVERFYAFLFAHRWSGNDDDSVSGRIDALKRLLDTAISKPPRFTVCVLARVLLAIAQVFLDHGIDAEPVLLDEGVVERLHRFMRDSVQENIPFWLDVRVTVILFAAITTFAAATASPRRCRLHRSFWRLYCMCGPLGESGGHSITSMDACGQYGLVGASVEERFLQHWLVQLSTQRLKQQQQQQRGQNRCDEEALSLVDSLLDVEGLICRVEALLRAPPGPSLDGVVDTAAVKETFFLIGALTRTGSVRHAEVVRAIADRISTTIVSLQTRAYCTPAQVLTSAACLVEFQHSIGGAVCAQLWPVGTTLQSMAFALHEHIMAALQASLCSVRDAPEALQLEGGAAHSLFEDQDRGEAHAAWVFMNTTNFDVLAAAVTTLNSIACDALTLTPTASPAVAAELLHAPEHVRQLMCLLGECSAAYKAISTAGVTPTGGEEARQSRLAAMLILSRNTARLLQSELCGYVSLKHDATTVPPQGQHSQDFDLVAHERLLFPTSLPSCREAPPLSAAASSRCPIAMLLPRDVLEAYVDQLLALPSQRVPSGSVPSALFNLPWSTLLSQQSRYICNALYVFLLCLPAAAADSECSNVGPSNAMQVSVGLVERVQDYALGQLDECWTANLASVYDVLLWVASSNMSDVVDHIAIADGMWEHMREVGARQYTRLAALAFTVLHYVMPHHPDYVKGVLLRVLEGEGEDAQTADRDVYFAALTASLQVLHDPANNWPVLREVMLYAAVFFNTNRDEEENESTVAVTEPLLWTWPEALRLCYPPTASMSAVGRAMAVATLVWCCHQNVAGRAVPLTMELLRINTCHPVLTHEPCMPNSRTHRARMRLWQLLCALLPCLTDEQSVPLAQVEKVFRVLMFHCVTVNNMGSVRRLMELYAIRLVEQRPSLYTVVSEALGNYSLRPQVCGSYILIACHTLLRQEETDGPSDSAATGDEAIGSDAFTLLFPRILQQSTSNQHLLRIISHIGLFNICQRRLERGRPIPPAVAAIYEYVLHAPEHVKFREKHAHMLFFDTEEASNPRNLFCIRRKEANTVLADVLPAAAFERLRFVETEMCSMIGALYPMELLRVHDWCASLRVQELLSVFKDFSGIPHTSTPSDYYVDYTREATELLTRDPMMEATVAAAPARSTGVCADSEAADVDAATTNVQKKVSSWWTSEVYNELHPRALRTQKQSIVVVGSLLENPVNIAGLCRCGEIFAAESIVVPEKKVFDHPHFVAAARSAELWIPWEEVMPRDLPLYLEGLRRRGYTIIGIEQTAASVSMEQFSFPERCAVVLGAEGQGVPAPLIPLLDVCVEIPQYGLIRSLNVHVTGAITMYEYTRQHLMAKSRPSV